MDLNLLSQLVRGRSRSEVIADLDKFFAMRTADQDKVRETIEKIFQAGSKTEFVRKPDLIAVVVNRLAGDSLDGDLRDRLAERCTEVIEAAYQLNPRKGVINPHYSPDSRTLAQAGNVR